MVTIGDTLTAVFAGFVIFAIIGYMAKEIGVPIEDVATQGERGGSGTVTLVLSVGFAGNWGFG